MKKVLDNVACLHAGVGSIKGSDSVYFQKCEGTYINTNGLEHAK